jgi:hypothetical protein
MLRSVPLEVLAQQAVRVFVDAALPATIWLGPSGRRQLVSRFFGTGTVLPRPLRRGRSIYECRSEPKTR